MFDVDVEVFEDTVALTRRQQPVSGDERVDGPLELSIVMPCLNEAATVAACVAAARSFVIRSGLSAEILVADNGSTDGSRDLARAAGARVVAVSERGYGAALMGGIRAARGRYIVMGDADLSYDFAALDEFVQALRAGAALVMGNRFRGGVDPGAMPLLHRYLGNPVLSWIGRLFFKARIGDFHCGLRGFRRDAILGLTLESSGMEFASEMVVKATLAGLEVTEVPTRLRPDQRGRPAHLRTWRDGWRHLRFLLLMSPRWLFLYPGLILLVLGTVAAGVLTRGPVAIGSAGLDIHSLLYAATGSLLGLQLVVFSLVARSIGAMRGLLPPTARYRSFDRWFSLERGLLLGGAMAAAGFGLGLESLGIWIGSGLSELGPSDMMRIAIPAAALMLSGAEIGFGSFVLAMIDSRPSPVDAGRRKTDSV